MEYKRIEDLNINECLERIQVKLTEAKSVITKGKSQADVTQSLLDISAIEASEIRILVINRLVDLLLKDKSDYSSCKNKFDYQKYLSAWDDGLWRKEAETSIKRIEEAEKESNYYESNKGSIAGLNKYLSSYPRGKYADSAKQLLNAKKKNRKITTFSISAIVTLIIAILCYTNYHSVSYLNAVDNVCFTKKGGTASRSISTDALGSNIHFSTSENWIKINESGKDLKIEVEPNHGSDKTGRITIYAYTTLFSFNLSRKTTSIEVHQASGIATNLEVTESSLHFEKYSSDTHTIYATTDGMNMNVTTEGIDDDWIDVTHDISEDGDNNRAKIVVSSHNNEGGEKHGAIIISSDSFERRISLSQESGLATYFNVSTNSLTMQEEGTKENEHYPIRVETDGTSWSVKDKPDWLNAEVRLSSGILSVTLGQNDGKIRIGTIRLLSNNGDLREIEVKQWGDPYPFNASPESYKFGTDGGNTSISISNNSQKALSTSISSGDSGWLSASVSSKTVLRINCSRNYNSSPRSGIVYVDCGGEGTSITIKQDGWETCSSCGGRGETNCSYCTNGYRTCTHCNNGYATCTNSNYTGVVDNIGQYGHGKRVPVYYWDPFLNMQMISGYRLEICPTCGGTFKVQCSYCSGSGRIRCSSCGGDGERECSRCDGKGKVKKAY